MDSGESDDIGCVTAAADAVIGAAVVDTAADAAVVGCVTADAVIRAAVQSSSYGIRMGGRGGRGLISNLKQSR